MAQGLNLSQKMALSQVLAPQLQQSLALLQAPTLELKALVAQELEQNPTLEEVAEMDQDEKGARNEEGDGYQAALINWRFLAHALWTTTEAVQFIEVAASGRKRSAA